MIWWLACAPPAAPLSADWSIPRITEAGHYTVQFTPGALRIHAAGAPVVDAIVVLHVPVGTAPLVDPGECDDIGEARCFHPGGIYTWGGQPWSAGTVEIDADAGPDSLVVPHLRGGGAPVPAR